ncbi:MAG: hypothetical protein ACOZJX_08830 [Pseudomonadota bacterium]
MDQPTESPTVPQATYVLSAKAHRRLSHLRAEVLERLQEMADLCEQAALEADPTLGSDLAGTTPLLMFKPHRHGGGPDMQPERLMDSITVVRYGSGPNMNLCYNDIQGLCYRC